MEEAESKEKLTMKDEKIRAEESSATSKPTGIFTQEGIVTLDEGNPDQHVTKKKFLMGMGSLAKDMEVVYVQKILNSSIMRKARLETFRIFSQAVATKCGGNANIQQAWYGASRDDILEIFTYGFSRFRKPADGVCYGHGMHLYPAKFSLDGVLSSVDDENGLRHVLLCQVILGTCEAVSPGSNMFHPSSEEFDCGVDNLVEPRRYIVWGSCMNSHILPTYILSFRAPCLIDFQRVKSTPVRLTPQYTRFSRLLSKLQEHVPPSQMKSITKCHSDYLKKNITKQQLIERVRQLAGDDTLLLTFKHL